MAPQAMYDNMVSNVFPFIKTMHVDENSTFTKSMKDATFMIPTPLLLDRVVNIIDDIPMEDRDTKGDLYEYLLSKIASSGQNGQFRSPRHIIKLMVEVTKPTPDDVICDPACGTAGFLIAASEFLRDNYPDMLHDKKQKNHFNNNMFNGSDFDATMLRIGAMNMLLHGIENPILSGKDSLSKSMADLRDMEKDIQSGLKELERMIK